MRTIVLWFFSVMALGAAVIATSQAKPVISSTRYMETIYHDCPLMTDVQDCNLSFTKIPAGKVLTIQNVNCAMSAVYNGASLMTAYLKVSNVGTVGTQVAIPAVIVGNTQSSLTYATNQQIFAFAAAGYVPTVQTHWSHDVNADMTCTIAGQLDAAN
jgi:hypothetical protein